MTTEEIEKAGKRYAYNIIPDENGMTFPVERSELNKAFKAGVQFADKHWQEKTKWIPVKERLPAFEGKRRTILVKTGDDLYSFLWIIQEVSLSDFECQGYTHWKEIELC